MRRLLTSVAVGAFVVLGSGVPASAVDNIALVVEPQLVQAGDEVKFTANNCDKATATVTFDPDSLGPLTLDHSIGNNSVWGSLKIPDGTSVGAYAVTAICAGTDVKATQNLYIYAPAPTPSGAPATGGAEVGDNLGPLLTAAGVGLTGLSGVAGYLALRRRRESSEA